MKTIKKLIKYFIIVFLIQSLCFPLLSSASTKEDLAKLKSSVKSEAAIVIEATTGKIIYSKNANTIKYPKHTPTKDSPYYSAPGHASSPFHGCSSKPCQEPLPSDHSLPSKTH